MTKQAYKTKPASEAPHSALPSRLLAKAIQLYYAGMQTCTPVTVCCDTSAETLSHLDDSLHILRAQPPEFLEERRWLPRKVAIAMPGRLDPYGCD